MFVIHRLLLIVLVLFTAPLAAEPVDFSLSDLNGKTQSLSDFRGKWVVVNFWATWCPPCLEEIPDLVQFHDARKDKDAVVLGINFEDATPEQLRAFVDDYLISYPILLNPDLDDPAPAMTVGGLPTTYIISPEGEVVARQIGPITAKAIEDYLAQKIQARADAQVD
jgi:thiol-disulfide isomerase/thioredoxin